MANNLIENTTSVFWTVQLQGNLYVKSHVSYGNGKVDGVEITQNEHAAQVYQSEEKAVKVACFIGGKLIKHTRTKVITEVTEEVEVI